MIMQNAFIRGRASECRDNMRAPANVSELIVSAQKTVFENAGQMHRIWSRQHPDSIDYTLFDRCRK